MPSHYLKILEYLAPYTQAASPTTGRDWAQELFDDLTDGGTCIVLVTLPANEYGPRVGLCGHRYFAEAGLDRDREDTLFVSRVESATSRLPKQVPRKVEAAFHLLSGDSFARDEMDSVRHFLSGARTKAPSGPQPKPTPLLVRVLAEASSHLRRLWRPTERLEPELSSAEILELLRGAWGRHRLDRFSKLSPRAGMIMSRRVNPAKLSEQDQSLLFGGLDVNLLNAFASRARDRELLALVEDLGHLPLAQGVRASVWAAMLAGLGATALRRELNAAVRGLAEVGLSSDSPDWEPSVLSALADAASRHGDQSLQDRVEAARSASAPLVEIASWAASLQFAEAEADAVERAPIESPEQEPLEPQIVAVAEESRIPTVGEGPVATSPVDSWVLWLRLAGAAGSTELAREFETRLRLTLDAARDVSTLARFRSFVSELGSLSAYLDGFRARLPDERQLQQDLDEAASAFDRLRSAIGEEAAAALLVEAPPPAIVLEVADLLSNASLVSMLPVWVWGEASPAGAGDRIWAARKLLAPEVRERVQTFAAATAEFGLSDAALLARITAPPEGTDLDFYLRSCLRGIAEESTALEQLGPEYVALRLHASARGEGAATVLQTAESLEELRPRVGTETFCAIVERISPLEVEERESLVSDFEQAVVFLETNFGSARDATLGQLDGWIAQRAQQRHRTPVAIPVRTDLDVDHNWTTERGARATISFLAIEGTPYGSIALPLAIEARRPADFALRLDLSLKGRWRNAWPSDWPSPEPLLVDIHRSDWRYVSGGERPVMTMTLRVPVRPPQGSREPLECSLTLYDRMTNQALSTERSLRWDFVVGPAREPLVLEWPEGLESSYVRDHPIGPQKKSDQLKQRIQSGNSFAVVAPRRFGKSTLLTYLKEHCEENGWIVPDPMACTSYVDGIRLDYESMWRDLSGRLQDLTGSSLTGSFSEGIPAPDAFDHVRAAARRKGQRGILVLLDEAQLLFPRGTQGPTIGDLLKDRIERFWSGTTAASSPVVLGLVGLPSLIDRGGANLAGLLRPIEDNEMGQADLNRLVLRVTKQRLETTREARQRLIETAPNLFLLRTLIENLVSKVNEERRSWASYDDVVDVESEVIAQLEAGEARHVGQWIRDALNDAETVNQWRPRAQYPVALAIARARKDGAVGEKEVIARAERLLNEWSAVVSEDSLERLSFGREQIEHHIRALNDDKILDQARFRSPLMQAWLIGDGRNGYPQTAVDALVKAAYREIRLPDGAEAAGEGGQASIFRFVREGAQMAFRRVEIRSDEDRKRFIETAQALDALSRGDYRDEPGARYIFELESIGFAAESNMTALQVYRWIDGHDLSEKVGSLGPPIVAELGVKLALALELIHARGILHRDVQPKNVVLSQDGKRPVLIDFGMARLAQRPMATALAGEYAAPEVRLNPPKWSRAADIFALGKTLERLLTPDLPDGRLSRAIRSTLADAPSERPDAVQFGRELRGVLDDLHVEQRKDEAWAGIAKTAQGDREKYWYWQVLESFRGNLSAMALGLPSDAFERCAEVADLVNQVLEAYPLPRGEVRTLSLGYVKNENERTGKELATREVEFLHKSRTWLSHGDRKSLKKQRALREFGDPTAEEMRSLVQRGVERVAQHLRVASLPKIVALLLAP